MKLTVTAPLGPPDHSPLPVGSVELNLTALATIFRIQRTGVHPKTTTNREYQALCFVISGLEMLGAIKAEAVRDCA